MKKTVMSFKPLGYAPAHGAYWRTTTDGKSVPRDMFEVGDATFNDGSIKRITKGKYLTLLRKQELRAAFLAQWQPVVGQTVAGWVDGPYFGTLERLTAKNTLIVATNDRGTLEVQQGAAKPMSYDEFIQYT